MFSRFHVPQQRRAFSKIAHFAHTFILFGVRDLSKKVNDLLIQSRVLSEILAAFHNFDMSRLITKPTK